MKCRVPKLARYHDGYDVAVLINTSLQRGVTAANRMGNRFNGFFDRRKTAEAVAVFVETINTSLKRGVNERGHPSEIMS
jgi:hypothetical protein